MIKKIKELGRSASIIQKLLLVLVMGFLNYFLYLIIQLFSLIIKQNLDWVVEWFTLFSWHKFAFVLHFEWQCF